MNAVLLLCLMSAQTSICMHQNLNYVHSNPPADSLGYISLINNYGVVHEVLTYVFQNVTKEHDYA